MMGRDERVEVDFDNVPDHINLEGSTEAMLWALTRCASRKLAASPDGDMNALVEWHGFLLDVTGEIFERHLRQASLLFPDPDSGNTSPNK